MSIYAQADARCASIAAIQHGVFNHVQAIAAGHTRFTIRRRLESQRWIRVVPGVYAINGTPITWEARCMAVTLSNPGMIVISGPPAAALHRFDDFRCEGPIEASTCTKRRPRGMDDVKIRRVTPRVLEESTSVRNIPTESVARIILNLCGKKHPRSGRVLDQALREQKVGFDELRDLITAEWTNRRRGIAILDQLVSERAPGLAPTASQLEDMYVAFTRKFSLPRGIEQWPMVLPGYGQAYFDFGYPLDRSAVEINSYKHHLSEKDGYDRDAAKQRAAKLAGINLIPLTHKDLTRKQEETAAELRLLLPNSCAARS
jgi:hypothetical protein